MVKNPRGYLKKTFLVLPDLSRSKTMNGSDKPLIHRNMFLVLKNSLDDFLAKSPSPESKIIVMPGLRGVGKTTLLFQLYNYLVGIKKAKKEQILYIPANETIISYESSIDDVIKTFEERYLKKPLEMLEEKLFILIDEAHYDKNWGKITQVLYNRSNNLFILVTGSSALALGINTDMARRFIKQPLYPMNLQEFLVLKYKIYPPKNTSTKLRESLFFSDIGTAFNKITTLNDDIQKKIITPKTPYITNILDEFLEIGGFPMSIVIDNKNILYERIIQVLEKIVEDDLPLLTNIGKNPSKPIQLLRLIAVGTGDRSYRKLSSELGISVAQISRILEGFTKSELIFPIPPSGSLDNKIRTKRRKICLTSSTIKAALLWSVGKLQDNNITKGFLLETGVASLLYKNMKIGNKITGLSYDTKSGGSDFVVNTSEKSIAIECCYGEKDIGQISKTMESLGLDFGILLSGKDEVEKRDNILLVPNYLFFFI